MAHKLLEDEIIESIVKKKKRISFSGLEGKFGIAVFIGSKELFLGLSIGNVIREEKIIRRTIKAPNNTVRVFKFDQI